MREPPNKGFLCSRCGEQPIAIQLEQCGRLTGKWFYRVRRFSICKNYAKKNKVPCRTALFDTHDDAAMSWLQRFGIIDDRLPTPKEIKRGLEIARKYDL